MQPGQPSHTALRAAAHRAAHQSLERGRIFHDPLAVPVLGADPQAIFETGSAASRGMRLFIAARSRFAEESLAAAVLRGVRQYVVLGAGLDTFAHRNPFAPIGLRVFEVDHPQTQGWKRTRLAEAGLAPPPTLTFAPVDFERQTLAEGLAAAGFDAAAPAFFSWLGVVVYLTRPAIFETLSFIARLPGAEVVFDYGEPVSAYPPGERPAQQARIDRMARLGEPWLTRFTADELEADLRGAGFDRVEDLGPADIGRRFYGVKRPAGPGGHLVKATRLDQR
ncbi:MAG TPA: SAM-dependent methyltransferase [Caulobacteraceae bacterium]